MLAPPSGLFKDASRGRIPAMASRHEKPAREKRKHPRVSSQRFRIHYRPGGFLQALLSRGKVHEAVLADCSEGGMKLLIHDMVKSGDALSIELVMPFMPQPFVVKGRITRCAKLKHWGLITYDVGLALLEPPKEYLQMVAALKRKPPAEPKPGTP